ncbi:VOC family protein [Microbacterium sp. X-17]|uniref:VOC family protein n=1 Tax=Microbacterium sp. X-17 TaxID=3144404 RepID=UPI0031F5A96F
MLTLNPYLSFQGQAREAIEFYQSVLGGDLQIMTFGDMPDLGTEASENDLVMHGQLETRDGFTIMASDTPSSMPYVPAAGVSISVSGDDEAVLEQYWDGLSTGGTIALPFAPAPWGGRFGMFTDRFGISWMLNLNAPA